MTAQKRKIICWIILAPAIYWGATTALIPYSARTLSTPQSCIAWNPFPHAGFLMLMGKRSVPALKHQIADPNVGLNSKIHLAWLLGNVGDFSKFEVFIDGLKSKRHQYIAAARMQDFPLECQRHLPAILAIGRQDVSAGYWNLLISLAYEMRVAPASQEAIVAIMDEAQSGGRGFTDREIQQLRANFANVEAPQKSRYWATGGSSAKNSSNAARQ